MMSELSKACDDLEREFLDPYDDDPLLTPLGYSNLRAVIDAARAWDADDNDKRD